ncbi:MAG TPA: hypothetical protein VIN62_00485, partial [Candidatus Cryosericum sp.]
LNVNVPNVPLSEVQGIMVTKQGFRAYENYVEKQFSPRGRAYYWIAGNSGPHDAKAGTDGYALLGNYVSVTPINLDLTCDELLEPLEARKEPVSRRLASAAHAHVDARTVKQAEMMTAGKPASKEHCAPSAHPKRPERSRPGKGSPGREESRTYRKT